LGLVFDYERSREKDDPQLMNKSLLLALLSFTAICRISFGADTPPKTNSSNQSVVEVKCQILTASSKALEESGMEYLNEAYPGLAGVFTKKQLDIVWKHLKGQKGILIDEFGDSTVKSGESGKIEKGYDFSYPVEYDASAKPIKMGTVFLGTKLELKPVESNGSINLSFKFEVRRLKEVRQIYKVTETDLLKKPTMSELVSNFPKSEVFIPVYESVQILNGSLMLYTDQTAFFSLDECESPIVTGKGPPQKMKLKDPSKRHFLIITATVLEPQTAQH
jgi:hypothetical protein